MQGEDLARRVAELEELLVRQRQELQAQIDALRADKARSTHRGDRRRKLSRAGLLKGAAAGLAGLAAAELPGSAGAVTGAAPNYVASGGTGTGFTTGSFSYTIGSTFYGSEFGVQGFAEDSSGFLNGGVGLRGVTGTGFGVRGEAGNGIGGYFTGNLAPVLLNPAAVAGPPTTGGHHSGEIMVDSAGVPFICIAGDGVSVGTWQAVGNMRNFPNGRRIFSNTAVTYRTNYGNINAIYRLSGTPTGIPFGAKAAYCAVQAVPTSADARLAIGPADGTFNPNVANFSAPVLNALTLTFVLVPLAATGRMQITSYLTGAVYVDVWGYLL